MSRSKAVRYRFSCYSSIRSCHTAHTARYIDGYRVNARSEFAASRIWSVLQACTISIHDILGDLICIVIIISVMMNRIRVDVSTKCLMSFPVICQCLCQLCACNFLLFKYKLFDCGKRICNSTKSYTLWPGPVVACTTAADILTFIDTVIYKQ